MGPPDKFTRNRRPRRCKSQRRKPTVPAVRHPAADRTHVVMDARVMPPVQLQPRIAGDNGYTRGKEEKSMKRIDYLEFISLMESFGVTDRRFIAPLFQQLTEADGFGGDGVEFAAAVIQGSKPRDYFEVMHAAQMAAMHWATMKHMRQVGECRGTAYQEIAVATATKLARTFTAQMEALKRYRTGGEQKVTVQHVSVGEGGQAIVGTVTQNALEESANNKMPALTDARQPAMPIIEQPERVPVPVRRRQKNEKQSST
jgi:hypothetical protein